MAVAYDPVCYRVVVQRVNGTLRTPVIVAASELEAALVALELSRYGATVLEVNTLHTYRELHGNKPLRPRQ